MRCANNGFKIEQREKRATEHIWYTQYGNKYLRHLRAPKAIISIIIVCWLSIMLQVSMRFFVCLLSSTVVVVVIVVVEMSKYSK